MKAFYIIVMIFFLVSCDKGAQKQMETAVPIPELSVEQANHLAQLPIHCLHVEYPNKLSQTLIDSTQLKSPQALHPAFYGCFDWHSSVHGHWSLVALMKAFPNLEHSEEIKAKLVENITTANITEELAYFKRPENKSFERTYGWAWLLHLSQEIDTWDDAEAVELQEALNPLTEYIVQAYLDFLPKLNYPIRTGEHPNTAFGLAFAYDYAVVNNRQDLKELIEQRSRYFYMDDVGCPIGWEPSGFDFLSPCLEEVDIMRRVLPKEEFLPWLRQFMPELFIPNFDLPVGQVSDRSDGKLVHLDGLNFSRAWSLYGLANQYPQFYYLRDLASKHVAYSLPSIVDDNYEGTHWLSSFAIYALMSAQKNDEH